MRDINRAPPRSTAKPEPTPQPAKVLGWEPIRCWRQSSAGAIAIGETFTVVLTCAVYEGDNAQVIPDESRLGVASIQLAPFEILGGSHPPDVRRGSRRFFQYDYQLRIISRDAIGHDVNIPPLPISYRIHSRVGAAATLEGRDLSYVMPMMPIKVLSLVPADAADIRDASEASLGAVDSLRFRSSLFRVLTLTFAALAAVMAGTGVDAAGAIARRGRRRRAGPHSRSGDRRSRRRGSARAAGAHQCRRLERRDGGPRARLHAPDCARPQSIRRSARSLSAPMASCLTGGCWCGTGSCARPSQPCRALPPRTTSPAPNRRMVLRRRGSNSSRACDQASWRSRRRCIGRSRSAIRPPSTKRFATPLRSPRTSSASAAGCEHRRGHCGDAERARRVDRQRVERDRRREPSILAARRRRARVDWTARDCRADAAGAGSHRPHSPAAITSSCPRC